MLTSLILFILPYERLYVMSESRLKNSVLLRMFLVGALSLLLLIPTFMVELLIVERQQRHVEAIDEVSRSWGGSQTLTGPVLTIPYTIHNENREGTIVTSKQYLHILPKELSVNSTITPSIRYRGIYEIVLYNTQSKLTGEFSLANLGDFKIPEKDLLLEEAFVTMGISDLTGIKNSPTLGWESSELQPTPGVRSTDVISSGITFSPEISASNQLYKFSLQIHLNGTSGFQVVPTGKETTVKMSSSWGAPSFIGSYLPETREVSEKGFEAVWNVLDLNRNFPQIIAGSATTISGNSFGVKLMIPVDEYQKTERTVKYAIMFIALTFLAYFLIEVIGKTILHPIQYVLVGLALVLFYILLLSISEHSSFNMAYFISGGSIIMLISAYTKRITRSVKIMGLMFSVLLTLYGFLYVVLQLEDYALLLGSIGLLLVLGVVMYLTRKIDWFSLRSSESSGTK